MDYLCSSDPEIKELSEFVSGSNTGLYGKTRFGRPFTVRFAVQDKNGLAGVFSLTLTLDVNVTDVSVKWSAQLFPPVVYATGQCHTRNPEQPQLARVLSCRLRATRACAESAG